MYRIIATLIFLFSLNTAVSADIGHGNMSPDEMYAAMVAGDIDEVERNLAAAHVLYLAGEADPNALRRLFSLFGTTDRRILSFTRDWLAAYPNSPFAHSAQAWNDYHTSFLMRGERSVAETYPVALDMFYDLQQSAWSHARRARAKAPRLLPATDALIRLGMTNGRRDEIFDVLDMVMRTDPNWGSLRRAVEGTQPSWGGTWQEATTLCDHYGPMLNDLPHDPVRHCKLYAAGQVHAKFGDPLFRWVQNTLREEDFPELDFLRLEIATSPKAFREDVDFAYEYLSDLLSRDEWHYEAASDFDRVVAWKFNYPKIAEAHYRAMQADAQDQLDRNPYDDVALKRLRTSLTAYERITDLESMETVVEKPAPDVEADYVRRQIAISPFDFSLWADYARLRFPMTGDMPTPMRDDLLNNAIVFSNHEPFYLMEYAASKEFQVQHYKKYMNSRVASIQKSRWRAVNVEAELICPMAQATRLYEAICEYDGSSNCRVKRYYRDRALKVLEEFDAERVCRSVYDGELQDLAFTPIDVEFPEESPTGQ